MRISKARGSRRTRSARLSSRRTLYRLFEPLGGVAQEVKTGRLKRLHQLLSSPEAAARQVALIAEEFGFADPTYFSRAFRQHFGYTGSPNGQYHHDHWLRALHG